MSVINKVVGSSVLIIAALLAFLLIRVVINLVSHEKGEIMTFEGPHIFHQEDQVQFKKIKIGHANCAINEEVRPWSQVQEEGFYTLVPDSKDSFYVRPFPEIVVPEDRVSISGEIIMLSDIEGDFGYLKHMLLKNEIIDEQYNWTFGSGHLVVIGDVFDRGRNVTECLWLLYKLEYEASESGGRVHFILGNHEIMALTGDDRYIHSKYKRLSKALSFEYGSLFTADTELGRWLRSKNTIEVIDDILFVHGGLSPELAASGLSIRQINNKIRNEIVSRAPKDATKSNLGQLFSKNGPLWYRGYFEEVPQEEEVVQILDTFDVGHIVVGHTIVPEVTSLYENRIIGIDVKRKIKSDYFALGYANEIFYKLDFQGTKNEI